MNIPTGRLTSQNSALLLDRFSQRIHGFNVRQQTLDDLICLCELADIRIILHSFQRLHGGALEDRGRRYLFINDLLSEPEKIIAGFHEFCHLTDHVLDVEPFHSTGDLWNVPKFERQANIIGVLAWMPEPLIIGMSANYLMREFGVSREVARFRLSLSV